MVILPDEIIEPELSAKAPPVIVTPLEEANPPVVTEIPPAKLEVELLPTMVVVAVPPI